MSKYLSGSYLAPYVPAICALVIAGQNNTQIARLLYAVGARSPHTRGYMTTEDEIKTMANMIVHLKKRWDGTYQTPAQRKRARWTPEDVWRETEGLSRKEKR